MNPFETWSIILLAATALGMLGTFWVYFFQLITMGKQLKAARESSMGENILSIINYLQKDRVRDARKLVIENIQPNTLSSWKDDLAKCDAASLVCSTYEHLGIMLKQQELKQLLPKEFFLHNWGISVEKCYETLEDYIKNMKKETQPWYYNGIEWLYKEAKKYNKAMRQSAGN